MNESQHNISGESKDSLLCQRELFRLVTFNILLAIVLSASLIYLVAQTPIRPPERSVASEERTDAGGLQNQAPISPELDSGILTYAIITTLLTVVVAGGAGGTLCNLRGLFKWIAECNGFPRSYKIPFYIRPLTGMLTGLFTLFAGHFLVSTLSETSIETWRFLPGRLPYIGLAILAGFAAQEFMEGLKAAALRLFKPTQRGD